jgi:hypothetical protein
MPINLLILCVASVFISVKVISVFSKGFDPILPFQRFLTEVLLGATLPEETLTATTTSTASNKEDDEKNKKNK